MRTPTRRVTVMVDGRTQIRIAVPASSDALSIATAARELPAVRDAIGNAPVARVIRGAGGAIVNIVTG